MTLTTWTLRSMGGKKKLTMKQMERDQAKKDEEAKEKKEKKEKGGQPREKRPASVVLPDLKGGKAAEELKKMKVLTPYAVASKLNIRISTAKDFLEKLEDNGAVQRVGGNHYIKIYRNAD
jgi:small subunit ribosomal protein S25e